MPVIISLTVIPPRFDEVYDTLESLTKQDLPDFEVHLYIPKKFTRFPDYDGSLPKVPKGVIIKQPDEDYGPASKVLHAVQANQDKPEQRIIFCDDDKIFATNWAAQILAAGDARPDDAICVCGFDIDRELQIPQHRTPDALPRAKPAKRALDMKLWRKKITHRLYGDPVLKPKKHSFSRSGYVDILEGYGGVLVKPKFFTKDVYDIPQVGRFVDDVWLSGHLLKNGYKVWGAANILRPNNSDAAQDVALVSATFVGQNRAALNRACVEYYQVHYGIWR